MFTEDKQRDKAADSFVALKEALSPWSIKRKRALKLAKIYSAFNARKAQRMALCGIQVALNSEDLTVHSAMTCKIRLCPLCTWRRALRTYSNMMKIVDYVQTNSPHRYAFLTLTIKNCTSNELSSVIDRMMKRWRYFINLSGFRNSVDGWYRGLEITHDVNEKITDEMWYGDPDSHIKGRASYFKGQGLKIGDVNPNYDMYHPHFHVLLALNPSYFNPGKYIRRDGWAEMWRFAMQLDYDPIVDVRMTFDKSSAAVAEASKYTVKDTDYIVPDDYDLSVKTVSTLDEALHARRLIAYGGLFKEIHKKLNLADEDPDIIDNDIEKDKTLLVFDWVTGYDQYVQRHVITSHRVI